MFAGTLVRLRAPRASDVDDLYRGFNDDEVTATLGLRYPVTLQFEREWV